jgi:poly(A) polymerase
MILPQADWQDRPGLDKFLAALGAAEDESRYVGGCVRDTLLGLPVSDVDLATRLKPQEVIERLQRARIRTIPTGIAHGTVTALVHGVPLEVTTLRQDVSTDGRRATIAYTGDWQEDAARRDFTINALFAAPISREIYDFFEGLADLKAGRVRFIGEALRRIAEDHLRILRFFRFHARFGTGEPDAEAIDACRARANDLMALSRERIADELLKLLALERPVDAIALMIENGIFMPVIPEIGREGLALLEMVIVRERKLGLAAEPVRRLAALLPPDPDIARAVAARLRLSKLQARRLELAADRMAHLAQPETIAFELGREAALDRFLLAHHGEEDVASAVEILRDWEKPVLGITGGDLIDMGLPPGPIVSRALRAIEQEWSAGGFSSDPEAVRLIARRQVGQLLRSSQ